MCWDPFAVVSNVEGRTLRDGDDAEKLSLDEASRCATSLVEALVALHSLSYADAGLGDYRLDKTILDPGDIGRIAAIVDWEMFTLGIRSQTSACCRPTDPITQPVLGVLHAPVRPLASPLRTNSPNTTPISVTRNRGTDILRGARLLQS